MGMPEIPDGKNRPTFHETIIDLLESIALEEMAISHLLNAQGEKMQELIKFYSANCICYNQLESGFKSSQAMITSLIMKEWLLITKMQSVLEIENNGYEKFDNCNNNFKQNYYNR